MVRLRRLLPLVLSVLLLGLTTFAGCGDDDGDFKDGESTTAADAVRTLTGDHRSTSDDPESSRDSAHTDGEEGGDGAEAADEASSGGDHTAPEVEVGDLGKPEGGDDEGAVAETVERYYQAIAAGDNKFACKLMSDKAERQIDRLLAQVPKRAGAGRSCAGLLDLLYGQVPEEMLTGFGDVGVTGVELSGEENVRAIAYLEIPGQGQLSIRLSLDSGVWRLDQLSGGFA